MFEVYMYTTVICCINRLCRTRIRGIGGDHEAHSRPPPASPGIDDDVGRDGGSFMLNMTTSVTYVSGGIGDHPVRVGGHTTGSLSAYRADRMPGPGGSLDWNFFYLGGPGC